MKRRIWMPIDSTEQERFRHVEVVLAALRRAGSYGTAQNNSADSASLAALDIKDLTLDGCDPWEALRAWLRRRVQVLARELDPRLFQDCLELRKLAFFTYYYLEQPASYPQICDLQPSSTTLLPNVDALLHWWEQITRTSISLLPPLPRHTQPAEKAIDDLLPVSSRTVGDNIRMAACRVFQVRIGRAPKITQSVAEPRQANEDNHSYVYERLQSAARLMARQWPAPKMILMPVVDLNELVQRRRSLIIGPPGAGKTTLLRRLMAALLECSEGGAVIVDLQAPETWNHLDQPGVLAAHALSLQSTTKDCEHILASGDMALLLDHVEFLPEPALQQLGEAVRHLPSIYVAVPAWCAKRFSNLPHFEVPPLSRDTVEAPSGSANANVLDTELTSTPLGVNIQSSLSLDDEVEAARYALLRLIKHANLGVSSADVMTQAQRLAITLAQQGTDPRHAFTPTEVLLPTTSERDFRFLVLTGLLVTDTSGYRFAYPDLVLASIRRDWLPLVLDLVPRVDAKAVIHAAKLIAMNEDHFAIAFLPELIAAIEQDMLPPEPVISAVVTLSGSTMFCHARLLQELIKRVDAAWRHKTPNDPRRQSCIRGANFLLKRFAQPRRERPVEDVKTEVANLLAGAEGSLDRESIWSAVHVADVAANASVLELIDAYFDAHPESQADLLIGCLKADTESGFDLFLALLRRPTFTCQAATSYIAAAFPDWIDYFSISLLQAFVLTDEAHPDDLARRFAASLWARLTAALA